MQDHLTGLKEFVLDQLKPEEPKREETKVAEGETRPPRIYLICDEKDEETLNKIC